MSGRCSRKEGSEAGFTLTELLVGMVILTIGLLAISTMVPTAYTTLTSSGSDTRALAFAQKRLDQLRALPHTDSALSVGDHSDTAPAAGYTQSYTVAEVNASLSPTTTIGVKKVTVTVTGLRARQVQLWTLITK